MNVKTHRKQPQTIPYRFLAQFAWADSRRIRGELVTRHYDRANIISSKTCDHGAVIMHLRNESNSDSSLDCANHRKKNYRKWSDFLVKKAIEHCQTVKNKDLFMQSSTTENHFCDGFQAGASSFTCIVNVARRRALPVQHFVSKSMVFLNSPQAN